MTTSRLTHRGLRFLVLAAATIAVACAGRARLPTLDNRPLTRDEARAAEEAYERGLLLAEGGDYDSALVEFTRVVEQFPSSENSALALYWQGRSFYQTGDDPAAETAFRRYLQLGPDVPRREHATVLLGNAVFGQGRFEDALELALAAGSVSSARLDAFLDLAGNLMQRLPREAIEATAQRQPRRNWLAPIYLQSARWAYAAGDTLAGRAIASEVAEFAGLPAALSAEARSLSGGTIDDAPPRIGLIAPTEGRFATVSAEIERGVQIALEELNTGRSAPYELVYRSTASDADSTIGVIRSLARGDRVRAVLGPLTSEFAIPAGEVAREEGIALVSPTATDARLLDMGSQVFTVNALDGALGHTIGTYAARNLGLRRFAILAVDNAYGRVQAEAFAAAVDTEGGRVIYRGVYEAGSTRFTDLLGEIVRARADAVFLATNRANEVLRILNQMAFFELDDLLPLGTDAWNDEEFIEQGRRFARGYFADTFSRDARVTRWDWFAQTYAERYEEPPANRIAAWGYDATRIAIEHLVQSGASSEGVYRGASGSFRLTPNGPVRAVVVHRAGRGGFEVLDW